MNIFDKFQGLWKREVPKNDSDAEIAESLWRRMDVDGFFNSLSNLWYPGELISKLGGYSKLEVLYKDADIYAAVDKRIAALLDTRLIIDGGPNAKFFQDQIMKHEDQLKQDFFWTTPYGYGVEQIIYNEDRSGNVDGFQKEDFWRFEPLEDLIHVKLVNSSNPNMINQVMPYGKFVVTTNNGTSNNPMGDAMFERLIQPWIFKCNGWDLWMDFAKRFANGFMHGKITDMNKAKDFRASLEKSGKSSIIITDMQTELSMINPPRDSSLYEMIDSKCVAAIQRVVLGETLTSSMADRGSSGAAVIHNEVRLEKTRADIRLVERGINEIITQIAAVNGIEGELPVATLIYDPGLNAELAARDTVLGTQGVKFNKKYYVNNYGLNEDEFEIVEPQPQSFFNDSGKTTFLSPEDMKEFLGSPVNHVCNSVKLNATASRRNTRQINEKEEVVKFLQKNGEPPINFDDLIAAINLSKNEKELDENLTKLFDSRNNGFVDTMTEALYYSATKGALLGNPERLDSEEE